MGLDWCLVDKPRPGFEDEYVALRERYDKLTDAEQERLDFVSVGPSETLGCPTVDTDEQTRAWYFEHVVRPHQERIKEERLKPVLAGPDDSDPMGFRSVGGQNTAYVEHWSLPDEELLARDAKMRIVDEAFTNYGLSTVQAYGAFAAMAGSFSFRGKAVQYSPLIDHGLRNETCTDMSPPEMADFAARIEADAMARAAHWLAVEPAFDVETDEWEPPCPPEAPEELVRVIWPSAEAAFQWCADQMDGVERPDIFELRGEAYEEAQKQFTAKRTHEYDVAEYLKVVLDGARWLRFWADLGHSMHAWY